MLLPFRISENKVAFLSSVLYFVGYTHYFLRVLSENRQFWRGSQLLELRFFRLAVPRTHRQLYPHVLRFLSEFQRPLPVWHILRGG